MRIWKLFRWYVLYTRVLEKLLAVLLGSNYLLLFTSISILPPRYALLVIYGLLISSYIELPLWIFVSFKKKLIYLWNLGIYNRLRTKKLLKLVYKYPSKRDRYLKLHLSQRAVMKVWKVFNFFPKPLKKRLIMNLGLKDILASIISEFGIDGYSLLWGYFSSKETLYFIVDGYEVNDYNRITQATRKEIIRALINLEDLYDPFESTNERENNYEFSIEELESPTKENLLPQKVYQINEYLRAELWDDYTYIYVNDEEFMQCYRLVINIPIEEIKDYDEINSIDDLIGKDDILEASSYKISPYIEFWGHCSNLQTWYEHGYDTRLLHSNLSFPLLKKLFEAGDPQAKKVFKEEVAQRFESGNPSVMKYLLNERYLEVFNVEELLLLIFEPSGELKPFVKKLLKSTKWFIEIELIFRGIYETGNVEMKKQIFKVLSNLKKERDYVLIRCSACRTEITTEVIMKRHLELSNDMLLRILKRSALLCDTCLKKKLLLLKHCEYQPPRKKCISTSLGKKYIINKYLSVVLYKDYGLWDIYNPEVSILLYEDAKYWDIFIAGRKVDKEKYYFYDTEPSVILESIEKRSVDSYSVTRPNISPDRVNFEKVCEILWIWNYFNYNTRLVHSQTSFPLLKELYLAGDPKAKRVFIKEIVRNLRGRAPCAIGYLVDHDYLQYIDKDKLEYLENRDFWGGFITHANKLKIFISNYTTAGENRTLQAEMKKFFIKQQELDTAFAKYMGLEHAEYFGMVFELLECYPGNIMKEMVKLTFDDILTIFFKLISEIKEEKYA